MNPRMTPIIIANQSTDAPPDFVPSRRQHARNRRDGIELAPLAEMALTAQASARSRPIVVWLTPNVRAMARWPKTNRTVSGGSREHEQQVI